jgi:prolyl oligopeptidase
MEAAMNRSRSSRVSVGILLACAAVATPLPGQATQPTYPASRSVDSIDAYHGLRLADPYRWMEAIDAPDVAEWVKAQNALTLPYLEQLPGRDAFKNRITALYNYARSGVPFFEGGRWFYSRNTGLQRQNVWYSRTTLTGPERMVLDPNALSPDGSVALSGFSPSPDGRHLIVGLSEGGADWVTFHVRDLASGRATADTIRWVKFSGASWTKDGRGFFYSRFPEPDSATALATKLENHTLFYHRLGTPQAADVRIYGRPDNPSWFVFAGVDESGRYLFINTTKGTDKNEVYVVDLGDPMKPNVQASVKPIITGQDANYFALGVVDGEIYMQVDRDAPRRKIVAVPIANPAMSAWRTVVPEGEQPIEGSSLVAGRLGVLSLEDVASVIRVYSLDGRESRTLDMPGLGGASGLIGRFDRPEIFFAFTSPLQPSTAYVYDVNSNTSTPFNAPKLTFDPSQLVTERVFYTSRDGTRVPMFVTHRKDLVKDGSNPTMLYAYGGFSISLTPGFRPDVIAWVEQGGVYATANIRGGGEYGEDWHRAGMFGKKQNVFDDFIAAGEYLVRERYTSPQHLAVNGGSNGGLLVGAVMTQRPELFAATVPQVGVMDMLRYDKFSGGAAWAVEYGSSSDPEAFRYLRAYSPLHNIEAGVCYPATLVTTADHDDRVVPSHSFKFAATLQAVQSKVAGCNRPALIRVEVQGSHGYRPLDRRIAEMADIWAFTARHTGMVVKPVIAQ